MGGGFGPYTVDQRDEETRERRNAPRAARAPRRGESDEREETRGPKRPALRVVGSRPPMPGGKGAGTRKAPTKQSSGKQPQGGTSARARRRRRGPAGVQDEMAQLAGRDASRALGTLMAAADAYSADREREAIRILRPLRDRMPDSQSVRELMGLSQYRVGNYNAAAKELEAYAELSGAVDQHPVLMDCYRAQRRWKKVADLWEELAAVSPSADVVTEGRIVYAGALADQDKLPEALALLRKRGEMVKQPKDHHLRVWYALADLEERAGNLARARELFHQVARVEPGFADVAERLAALG